MSTIVTFILVLVAAWSVLIALGVSIHRHETRLGYVHPRNTIGHAIKKASGR